MSRAMGEILVDRGVLTAGQRDEVLRAQRGTGRPFGELAERMFGVGQAVIESVWATQYAEIAEWVDPSAAEIPEHVLGVLSGRQAVQFGLVPLRYAGRSLVLCTTQEMLARALRFASATFGAECSLALCEPADLDRAIGRHYGIDVQAWRAQIERGSEAA